MPLESIVDNEIEEISDKHATNQTSEKENFLYDDLLRKITSLHLKDEVSKAQKGKWVVYENEIPTTGLWLHQNLATYVEGCYATHAGVVFRPDMFYFCVYSEIANYVVANAEECRHIFTDKPDKQDIKIMQDTSKCIEFDKLVDKLKEKIPTKVDELLPEFSTDCERSKEARFAAFAEACSPYYNYFTFLCGIRKVRLEGTIQDWTAIEGALSKWMELLPGKEIKNYVSKVLDIAKKITPQVRDSKLDNAFWKKMFWNSQCGSGHPEYEGWLMDVCNKKQKSSPYDIRGQVTSVYWQVIGGPRFVVHHGLLSSEIDNAKFLVPFFRRIIFKFEPSE